jgi:hypothetical protein
MSTSLLSWECKVGAVEKLTAEHPQIQIVKCDGVGGTLQDWRFGQHHHIDPPANDERLGWDLKFL